MNPVDSLKAVLCGQDGKCCIAGSEADRKVVDEALAALDTAQPVPDVNALLVEALQFYADKGHFMLHNEDAWETVSGEPQNFFEDESNTATVEDGSVARAALTAAKQAQPEPDLNKLLAGKLVSMDVSTGEDDAFNRVFGRVCEVMLESCGAQEDTILAIEESRNFEQAQPEPFTPDWSQDSAAAESIREHQAICNLLLKEMRHIADISTGQVKRVAEQALEAVKQAQPARPSLPDEWPEAFQNWYRDLPSFKPEQLWPIWSKQAQPERAPLSDKFLQPNDYHLLHSFIETTEDDEGYDITKAEIKRLADLGVVQLHGFGKYSVTMFGYWVHERYWEQNPSLPLKTNSDRNAEAAIKQGGQHD